MKVLNLCQFIGNLGQKPEVRFMPNGDAVVNLSVAVTKKWNDKQSGEKKEHTEWVRVSFFGRQAELAGKYLDKGSKVYVQGSMQTRKYQAQDGSDRYSTEIKGESMQFLDPPKHSAQNAPEPQRQAAQTQQSAAPADFDDDIPF